MATATNRQRLLAQLFTGLKKRYASTDAEPLPVLEQFLYAICREGTTREKADRAYRELRERFFDWNEIRVSSAREIEEVLRGLPHAESRANRLIMLLQEVFETTYSFDLESLQKKGVKQAAKHLARYQAANPFTVAWVTQQSLGGHAIPVDEPTIRVLRRTGLLEDGAEDYEVARTTLEHLVPKAKGAQFSELVSALADDLCCEEEPECAACPLRSECQTGSDRLVGAAERGVRSKPR